MHEWRNWKTRQTKDLVSVWICEFESHFVYHAPYHSGLGASWLEGGLQRSGALYCRMVDWQYTSFISCPMWVRIPLLQPSMLRVAQKVRASGCGPEGRRFESAHAPHGILAQLVERQTEDLRVTGPIPVDPTIYGRMPESGQKGRTVNPLASVYVGSNPTSPTKRKASCFDASNLLSLIVYRENVCGSLTLCLRKNKKPGHFYVCSSCFPLPCFL